jgi:hypothetical protein
MDTTTSTDSKETFAEFLESTPPSISKTVAGLYIQERSLLSNSYVWAPATPDIKLYCASSNCGGLRFFSGKKEVFSSMKQFFLTYSCKNCNQLEKTFAVLGTQAAGTSDGTAYKLGENPPFGLPTPSKVIALIGPDRELFLMGRRAENDGLGIGAFAYYRRVVENQSTRIIGEIEKAAKRLGVTSESIQLFEKAKKEVQFSKAIDVISDGIPPALLIRTHNPLKLLHSALSKGLHAHGDDECLEIATSIRLVLSELAERISNALRDENELKQAVNRLLLSTNAKSVTKES